jgi:DnaJ family protein C protein 7
MLKRYADAKRDATAILEVDGAHVKAMSRLSKACLGTGDVDAAVRWAEKALRREPGVQQLKTDLAKMRRVQQEAAAAARHLDAGNASATEGATRRARALCPDVAVPGIEVALARALLLQGRGAEALSVSRSVAAGDAASSPALLVHVDALLATGNVGRALAICQSAVRSDPDNVAVAKAYKRARALDGGRERGNAAFKAGQYQVAHDEYTASLKAGAGLKNTFVAQVATNRANACLKLQRYSDAVDDTTAAIEADETFAKAYLRRAQAYELLGKWEEAVRDLSKVRELDDGMPGIAEKLRHAKVELKKSKRVDY